ncbi:MAG: 3-dehydroquinate synthase [Oscillospiraceae bacterium]|jgi:3-dehydroquinate synthase|nr:3-dehydroquinate synthase [Oscillospiraceae bacterium]
MKEIRVKTAQSEYGVIIGFGALKRLESLLLGLHADCVVFVADTNTISIARQVYNDITGIKLKKIIEIPAGEVNKTPETAVKLCSAFAASGLTRGSVAVAVGGGVIGDTVGFAAAIYLRGIRFVQVPTTIIAATDSSVGGKTGVDLPEGKNLIGAFRQPEAVFADTCLLDTLPGREITSGLGEVLKYYLLGAFEEKCLDVFPLSRDSLKSVDFEELIARCVEFKARLVCEDEFDNGVRRYLNLGHTFGHALEKHCEYTRYNHGEAVAIGIKIAVRLGIKLGITDAEVLYELDSVAWKMGLQTDTELKISELFRNITTDKKRLGDNSNIILLKRLRAPTVVTLTDSELREAVSEL